MNAEIFAALAQLEKERGIPQSYMIDKITQALVAAYKKDKEGYTDNVFVEVDGNDMHMYVQKEVVDDVLTPATEISLDAARKINKHAELGDLVNVDVRTQNFGRIAAQTAKQVIIQGIREAERGMIFDTFSSKEHEILTGTVLRVAPDTGDMTIRLGGNSSDRTDAMLAASEQVKGESYREGDIIRVFTPGAGGGGDPYVGKLVAIGAVQACGPVTLLDPEEVPDDALVIPIAMMGAPTVLAEKAIGGTEYQKLYDMVSSFFGKKIYAFMPIEAGGVNSMLPIAAAARLGLPLVDVDGMGRAFPELQMVTFTIGGMRATPMALTDEKGNSCIFETITNKWTEELARAVTMSCGASVSVSLYPMSGKQMKEFGVHGIVTRSEKLGKAIRTVKDCGDRTPEEHFLEFAEGFKLFKGKIADVLRETRSGFNFGKVVLDGIGEDKGSSAYVEFQNENLTATVDGEILATTPDLICLVDTETFIPVTTDALKYGKRVMVVGLKCFHLWRTQAGLELVGPRYFGVDTDYIPLEERCKGGH